MTSATLPVLSHRPRAPGGAAGWASEARGQRAKEDQVLSRVRRAVTLAVAIIGPALSALVVVIAGAKRW